MKPITNNLVHRARRKTFVLNSSYFILIVIGGLVGVKADKSSRLHSYGLTVSGAKA